MNLQNLINYCRDYDLPDPLSGVNVPAPLNPDMVKNCIMVRCGLLTPVFNDPDTFTASVTVWFARMQWTFEHLINIVEAEYSPIENVYENRKETTTFGHNNTRTGGYKDTDGGKDTAQNSGTDKRDISNSGTDTTTNEISAFNATTYQADNKSSTLHGHKIDDDLEHGLKTETTYGKTSQRVYNSEKDQEGGTNEFEVFRHGNIGVTTNQQMIEEELRLLQHFDIYGYIAELFERDNMIMVY